MTLYRNLFECTRFCMYATATGAALCSLIGRVEAQQNPGPVTYPHPRAINQAEPARLPQGQMPIRPVAETVPPVQLLAGEAPAQQNARQKRQEPAAQDSEEESHRIGLGERLSRLFRSKPTTPPVDPGMHYPKASEAVAGPPPAPGASGAVIPSIPPTYGSNAQQPALFEPGTSVNAIGTNLIPSIPGSPPSQPPVVATAGPSSPPLQHIPELKALMVSDESPASEPSVIPPPATLNAGVPAPAGMAQETTAPQLNLNAPLPEAAPRIAPGEPSESATLTAQADDKNDPFANLFPADKKPQPAEHPLTDIPEAMASAPAGGPYTGLSLDASETDKSLDALPPPPAEEMPVLAGRSESRSAVKTAATDAEKSETVKLEPIQTAQADPTLEMKPTRKLPKLGGPPPVPGVPESELSIPKDLPKLASTAAPQIEIKPASPKLPPSSTQDDSQSKMEKIAARKDLKGLKGFCPVVLRDERNLVDSSVAFTVTHNGHEYALSSSEAREKFLADPTKYAPAAGGCDVIHLALTGERQEGSLDHAVWYKGRLYLFSGVETMETFVAAPSSHATDD